MTFSVYRSGWDQETQTYNRVLYTEQNSSLVLSIDHVGVVRAQCHQNGQRVAASWDRQHSFEIQFPLTLAQGT